MFDEMKGVRHWDYTELVISDMFFAANLLAWY